jgi:D-alanine-D-alanine ligase
LHRRSNDFRIGFAFNLKPTDVASSSPGLESISHDGSNLIDDNNLDGTNATDFPSDIADAFAEWDDESTIDAIENALSHAGEVIRLEATPDFPANLRAAQPDIVFNFAEGLGGPSRESHIPSFCEFWGIPYTGSDPLTLGVCLDKARTKEVLIHHGIPTPDFQVVDGPAKIRRTLELPVIVKPLHEGSSKGISTRSLCHSWDEVESEVARLVDRYSEPAIIERFLSGREFTVAILGNDGDGRALPIVELDFGVLPSGAPPLYGFEAKWIWDGPHSPLDLYQCPARCTPQLQSRIEEIAMAAFKLLRCRDWARIDIRCDESDNPHILEVNPLPGVLPDPDNNSCYPKAARAAGLSFDEVILAVLRAAAVRYGLRIPV